jgi:uncharacterized phosphosugar-binding protein
MLDISRTYLDHVVEILQNVATDQKSGFIAVRIAVATALASDHLIYIAGSGHSHLVAAEAFFRAGGIAAVQPIFDPSLMLHVSASNSSLAEREPGIAARVLSRYDIGPGDIVFVVSNSGRNAFPIEVATIAKEKGATTIAITSMEHTRAVTSRHASGKRLFEIADIVLDNGALYGDACLEIGPDRLAMGPVSTISGAFIINAVIAEAVAILADQGTPVDVYQSSNGKGGEAAVDVIVDRWKTRIKGL